MRRKVSMWVLGMLVSLALGGVASADHVCTSLKVKATGKKAFKKLICHHKAAKVGLTVDPLCLTKAETKFDEKFARADTKPPCFATGDAAAIEAKVDAFVDDAVMELRPAMTESRCAGLKLKAAGKKAFKKLNCHRKAVDNGGDVDPICLTQAETKFTEAFAKAEAKGDCLTLTDEVAIEGKVDAFVDDAVMELRPVEATDCSPRKVRAVGDKASRKLDCYADAVFDGVPVDSGCLTQAETAFSDDFADAEVEGDCYTTGDEAAIEAKVDAFVDDVQMELTPSLGPSKCANIKLRQSGRKAEGKLRCYFFAYRDGLPVDPECLTTQEANFSFVFAAAEENPDCLTTGDEAAIEAKVDAFITDVTMELLP